MPQTAIIQRALTFQVDPDTGIQDVMIFDSTISEEHNFEVAITENPVETGVNMADHAYARPMRLTMEVVVTNTPLLVPNSDDPPGMRDVRSLAIYHGLQFMGPNELRTVNAWQAILAKANSFAVFDVQTGLILYPNMMLDTGSVKQKVDSAGIMRATISLHQVTFATTSTVVYPPRAPKKPKRQAAAPKDDGHQTPETPTDAQEKPISIGASALGITPESLKAAQGMFGP